MSLTTDVRAYADAAIEVAVEQARHALDQGKQAVNVDALRSSIEPYVATALTYTAKLAGRAEAAVAELRSDARVASVIHTGEALAAAVVEAVSQRVGQAGQAAASSAAAASSLVRPHSDSSAPVTVTEAAPAPQPAKTTAAKTTAAKSTAAKSTAAKSVKAAKTVKATSKTAASKSTTAKPAAKATARKSTAAKAPRAPKAG
jgi:ABC-2 type transport system ATP-binding protein